MTARTILRTRLQKTPLAQMSGFPLSSSTRSHGTPASSLLAISIGDWDMQKAVGKTRPETVQSFEE